VNDGTAPNPIDPRKVRWQEDLKKVLSLTEPMTQTDVTNAVDGNVQRGYLIIRQLIREGKVMKEGRGEEAVYKLTEAGKTSLAQALEQTDTADNAEGEDAGEEGVAQMEGGV